MDTSMDTTVTATPATPDHELHSAACSSCSFFGPTRQTYKITGGSFDGKTLTLCRPCRSFAAGQGAAFMPMAGQ